MKELEFMYSIRSAWRDRPDSPASIGGKFVDTLDALTDIDPTIFANWSLAELRAMKSIHLDEARSRIGNLMEKNVTLGDYREPLPEYGYSAVAHSGKFKDPRYVTLRVKAGGKFDSDTLLQFGDYDVPPDLDIVTQSLFKAALLAMNAIWQAPWACAYAYSSHYYDEPLSAGAPLFPYSKFHITWIGYLSEPLAQGLELPPQILTERTAEGGVVMTAVEERLDPADPEHLRRARILAETMVKHTGDKFGPKPQPVIYFDPDTGRHYNTRTGKTVQYDARTREWIDE
jgi:Immunity protein 52